MEINTSTMVSCQRFADDARKMHRFCFTSKCLQN